MHIKKIFTSKTGIKKTIGQDLIIIKTIKGELYIYNSRDKISINEPCIFLEIQADTNIHVLDMILSNKIGSNTITRACNYLNENNNEIYSEINFDKININYYMSPTIEPAHNISFPINYYNIKKNYIFTKTDNIYFQFRTAEGIINAAESQYIYTDQLYDITIPYYNDGVDTINYNIILSKNLYADTLDKYETINCNLKKGEALYIFRMPAKYFDLEINIPNGRECLFFIRDKLSQYK